MAFKRGRIQTVINDETKAVLNEYELMPKHLRRLWASFCNLDRRNMNYISIERLIAYLSEREYSIIAPFAYRFFELVDKEIVDKVSFQELVIGLIYFNTFNR